jgi:hypothetical protein
MRKITIVVVVLALIWAIPGARSQLITTAHPALERMGPAAAFMIQPARREAAKKQMNAILRVAASDISEGRDVPMDRRFEDWMQSRMPELSGRDPWGQPYWLRRTGTELTVYSAGPDAARGTEDDLSQTVHF